MHQKKEAFSSFQIIDVETVGGDAVPVEIPLPNRAPALEINDAVAVAVEGMDVGAVQTKVTSQRENVGIGEGSENVAILKESVAGGGGVGGGVGVLHFLVLLFVFVFVPISLGHYKYTTTEFRCKVKKL